MLNSQFPQWLQDAINKLGAYQNVTPQSYDVLVLRNTLQFGSDFVSKLPSTIHWGVDKVYCYIKGCYINDGIAIEIAETGYASFPFADLAINYVIRVAGCPFYFVLCVHTEGEGNAVTVKHLSLTAADFHQSETTIIKEEDTVHICGNSITYDMLISSILSILRDKQEAINTYRRSLFAAIEELNELNQYEQTL